MITTLEMILPFGSFVEQPKIEVTTFESEFAPTYEYIIQRFEKENKKVIAFSEFYSPKN
jgi:hypothetical protein